MSSDKSKSNPATNLIEPTQAAAYLKISLRTLAKWRSTGSPSIPYIKIGRCIRYRQADLDAYLAEHTVNSVED